MPHSNIQRTVGVIQDRIFSRFGLTSAVALPALIPIRFVSSEGRLHAPKGMTVRTTSYETAGCSLYLGVELRVGEKMLAVRDIIDTGWTKEETCAPATPNLFPDYTGFYLCTAQDNSLLPSIVKDISPPPKLDFHPLGVVLLTLKYLSARTWWSHLCWEIGSLEKIRK